MIEVWNLHYSFDSQLVFLFIPMTSFLTKLILWYIFFWVGAGTSQKVNFNDIGYEFIKKRPSSQPLFNSLALQQYILLCAQVHLIELFHITNSIIV